MKTELAKDTSTPIVDSTAPIGTALMAPIPERFENSLMNRQNLKHNGNIVLMGRN